MTLRSALLAASAVFFTGVASAAQIPVQLGQANVEIDNLDVDEDVFVIDTAFGLGDLVFDNQFFGDGSVLADDVNIVVVQNSSNEDGSVFNAGSAAALIAASTEASRPGFFYYFNSALNINRLVFDEDLSQPGFTTVVIAALNPTGNDAIAQLPLVTTDNFVEAPLPAAGLLFGSAFAAAAFRRRKPKLNAAR